MDAGEDRLTGNGRAKDVGELEGEIGSLRDEIDVLVAELDRRRHQAFGAVAAVRNARIPLILAGVAAGALFAWWVYAAIHERRDARRPVVKLRRLRAAVARAIDDPERVAAGDPTMKQKVAARLLTTAGTALITAGAKALLNRRPVSSAAT